MTASQPIKAARGVRDILPADRAVWRLAEQAAHETARRFGYQEIVTPVIEAAELVERGAGETTDIVQKEVYKFQDRGERWLVLRPEGTAPTMRAYHEGNLNLGPQPARLYSIAPMFRYDRPQAGRYRQHVQFNVEAIGDASPALDAEVIELAWTWYRELGLRQVTLQVNSIGDATCRPAYREALLAYYRPLADQLCEDCRRRLETNPLRLLDCKKDERFKAGAPVVTDYLCDPCREAFAVVQAILDSAGIPYTVNPRIVRGLDYYVRTAFEFHHTAIGGAQNSLGGGGRYDGLAEEIGWPATPGVGCGLGIDRTVEMMGREGETVVAPPAAEVLVLGGKDLAVAAAEVARLCRSARSVVVDHLERSMRAKMRAADKLGVRWVVILEPGGARTRRAILREMASGEQSEVGWDELVDRLS